MSTETLEWLRENTLIGYTEKRGKAWHARHNDEDGNHYPGPVPIEDVSKLLGYELAEASLNATVINSDGVLEVPVKNRKAIVRLDTGAVFGIFGAGYKIHRPQEWLVDNLNLILDGGLNVGSALALKGGAVAAIQAELSDTREAAEGVLHRPFLSAVTSHDGSLATTYFAGTTVIHCDNTLSAGLRAVDVLKHKVRHSRNSLDRISDVRERLDLVVEQVGDLFEEEVKRLTSEVVSEEKWQRFLSAFTNPKGKELSGRSQTMADTKAATLNRLWNYDERVAPWRGNAYGVVAAVNTFTHWEAGVKNVTRDERNGLRMASGEFNDLDASTIKLLAAV